MTNELGSRDAFTATGLSKEEQDILRKFKDGFDLYKKAAGKIMEATLNGQDEKASEIASSEAVPAQKEARETLNPLIELNAREAEASQKPRRRPPNPRERRSWPAWRSASCLRSALAW